MRRYRSLIKAHNHNNVHNSKYEYIVVCTANSFVAEFKGRRLLLLLLLFVHVPVNACAASALAALSNDLIYDLIKRPTNVQIVERLIHQPPRLHGFHVENRGLLSSCA